jgi:hypothetical protein
MIVEVNYLSVVAAAVSSMALGFLWYSHILFGKMWIKEKGLTAESLKENQKGMAPLYGLSVFLGLVTAYVLYHVMSLSLAFYDYPLLSTGLTSAFWMWLGFVMPVQATGTIFGNKNWKLFGIDTGFQLASLLLMGIVLAMLA